MTSPTAWLKRPSRPKILDLYSRSTLKRLTASTTASGVLLVGAPALMPVTMDYVVRPGDTLSEIADQHDVSVSRLVRRNNLHPSGDQVVAGERLHIPSAHGRGGGVSSAPAARPKRVSPDARKIVRYTVREGDTPSGLAVRFHAWTAELIEMNGASLRVGERIRIPVVLAAVAEERRQRARANKPSRPEASSSKPATTEKQRALQRRLDRRADPSRAQVRRIIERTAAKYGVNPDLALAVSWQEAGWQQHHVSHANAIGAMQVIPATGDWMSNVVGRRLDLLDVRDNVTAGVVLLRELNEAASPRRAIAGYYQGLAGVRKHGMYADTKQYVRNVLYLKRAFADGNYPG